MNARPTAGMSDTATVPATRFYTVPQAARLIGTAPVTLYRAIRDGEFPALRIRGRLIIPAKAIDAMVEAAVMEQGVVDAASWTAVQR